MRRFYNFREDLKKLLYEFDVVLGVYRFDFCAEPIKASESKNSLLYTFINNFILSIRHVYKSTVMIEHKVSRN